MDIVIDNVSKSYGDKCVLDNLSVTFTEGEIHCIMGESGVGKTTLLRLIMGLEAPDVAADTGKTSHMGFDKSNRVSGCSGSISGVGNVSAVFQENRLIEDISAVANVKLVVKNISDKEIEDELTKLLPRECIYQNVSELSGGMQRRVAIVRAMMSSSHTVCMDEPFTGLDDDNKANVCRYIKDGLRGRTALVVTHDKSEAKELSAKIYLLTSNGAVATIIGNC